MYKLAFTLAGFLLMQSTATVAEVVKDPMQPPAFALNKFRLAKLKNNGVNTAQTAAKPKAVKRSLQLSYILIGKKRRVAIIDDQMLVVGDKIDDARLVKVFKDRVHLVRNGKKIVLKLDNEITAIRKQAVESKL